MSKIKSTSVRMPKAIRDIIVRSAHTNGISMNKEIVRRLESSMGREDLRLGSASLKQHADLQESIPTPIRISAVIFEKLKAASENNQRSFAREVVARLNESLIEHRSTLPVPLPSKDNSFRADVGVDSPDFHLTTWLQGLRQGPFALIIGASGTGKSVLFSKLVSLAVSEGLSRVRVLTEAPLEGKDSAATDLRKLSIEHPTDVLLETSRYFTGFSPGDLVFIDCAYYCNELMLGRKDGDPYPVCMTLQTLEDLPRNLAFDLVSRSQHLIFCGPSEDINRHWPAEMPFDASAVTGALSINTVWSDTTDKLSLPRYCSLRQGDTGQPHSITAFDTIQ